MVTIQTLCKLRPVAPNKKKGIKGSTKAQRLKYKKFISRYDFVIYDEVHHLTADEWRGVMKDSPAIYKIGLSATVFLKNESECAKGVIWLMACCGHVRHVTTSSYLIKHKYLVRPTIELYPIRSPNLSEHRWSQELQREAILLNPVRNELAVKLAAKYIKKKKKILMVSNRKNQVSAVAELLDDYNLPFAVITGENSTHEREEAIELYVEGVHKILLGTVLGEGIDIPEIDVVVILEGGKDAKRTVQRLRNLTPREGKTDAIVLDFVDMTNPYFAEHSRDRIRTYRKEEEFIVKYKNAML